MLIGRRRGTTEPGLKTEKAVSMTKGDFTSSVLHRQDGEIAVHAKPRLFLLGSVKMALHKHTNGSAHFHFSDPYGNGMNAILIKG